MSTELDRLKAEKERVQAEVLRNEIAQLRKRLPTPSFLRETNPQKPRSNFPTFDEDPTY